MVKSKYNWDKLRKEFQESDLSYSAFSKVKGIPPSTAYTHLKDLIAIKNVATESASDEKDVDTDDSFDFVPIEVIEAEAKEKAANVTFIRSPEIPSQPSIDVCTTPIEIKIKGCSIALNAGFDKVTLKDALEVLTELC